jgi:hypothetical protein
MEPHQKTIHPCPFCQNETLEVLTWPGHTAVRSSRSAVAKSTTFQKKEGGFELLSESCSNCGKTDNEIKKAWKEGINDNQEVRRRRLEELKKLGFSGRVSS